MFRAFRSAFSSASRPSRPRGLSIEALETRETPSVSSVVTDGSLMTVYANDYGTSVVAEPTDMGIQIRDVATGQTWNGRGITELDFIGGAGDDSFINNVMGLRTQAWGKAGNDYLEGYNGLDSFYGGRGNDVVTGWGGDDVLRGGADNDLLLGMGGNDTLRGGLGTDWLFGQGGNNDMIGNPAGTWAQDRLDTSSTYTPGTRLTYDENAPRGYGYDDNAIKTPASTHLYGNFLGEGNAGWDAPTINSLDAAAKDHDIAYDLSGASGVWGYFFNPTVSGDDWALATRAWDSLWNDSSLSTNDQVWAAVTATVTGAVAYWKELYNTASDSLTDVYNSVSSFIGDTYTSLENTWNTVNSSDYWMSLSNPFGSYGW